MNLYPRSLIIILCCCLLSACNYRWTKAYNTEGKMQWVKEYKSHELEVKKRDQFVFEKRYNPKEYSKYSGKIFSDTTHGLTFVQFDSIRVYMYNELAIYKNIFTSGLVSPQMIYCVLDSLCRPFSDPKYKCRNW